MARYKITREGIFEVYKDDLFEGLIKTDFPISFQKGVDVFEDPADEKLEQELSLIFKKMPLGVFQQCLAFMEAVWKKHHIEVIVCHKYIDGKWENFVPHQWNSSTSICYHPELTAGEATRIVGDTHLHPPRDRKSGGSYHSQTDNMDERKNDGLFIVATGFTPFTCDADVVGVVRGKRFNLRFESLVDPTKYDPKPSFPPEWMDRVKTSPCDGCRLKSDALKAVNEKKEERDRLLPETMVEAWRKRAVDPTNGMILDRFYGRWLELASNGKPFRCDNTGCKEFFTMPECPHCKKSVTSREIVKYVAIAIDELGCWDRLGEDKTQALKASLGTGTDEKGASSPDHESDFLLVHTGGNCNGECPYNDVLNHGHVASKEVLEKLFRDHVGSDTKVICRAKSGCLSRVMDCTRKCALADAKTEEMPNCTVPFCEKAGHVWPACAIHTAREKHFPCEPYCPSAECKKEGHNWHSCEVRRKTEAAAAKETAKEIYCGNLDCERSKHAWVDCAAKKEDRAGRKLPMVISNNVHCYPTCSFAGKPHEHTLTGATEVPISTDGFPEGYMG